MRKLQVGVFVVALGVRLILLFGFHRVEFSRAETVRIAISIARNGSFADPYLIPTGPTAHTAPLYPAASAPFYAIFGDTDAADMARFAFNAVAAAAGYALMPTVTQALGLGWWPGFLAGALGAIIPLHYWVECANDSESSWTALFLEVAVLWFARLMKGVDRTGAAARSGLFWGAGLLLSPTVAPVLAGFLAIALAARRLRAQWLLVFTAVTLATVSPWVVRNSIRLGGLTLIRDNAGLELFISNHDGATALADENYWRPYWKDAHPDASMAAALEIRQVGELEFERRKLRQALEWIRSHPGPFLSLTLSRAARFWFPKMPRTEWAFWAVSLLAGVGWVLLFRTARPAAVILGVLLICYWAPLCFIQFTLRYEHPIWWALVLLAAWPLSLLAPKPPRAVASLLHGPGAQVPPV